MEVFPCDRFIESSHTQVALPVRVVWQIFTLVICVHHRVLWIFKSRVVPTVLLLVQILHVGQEPCNSVAPVGSVELEEAHLLACHFQVSPVHELDFSRVEGLLFIPLDLGTAVDVMLLEDFCQILVGESCVYRDVRDVAVELRWSSVLWTSEAEPAYVSQGV